MTQLHLGDCLQVLPTLEAGSIDAVVTDPPAGIGFMGKTWDRFEAEGGSHISERLPTVTVGGTPNRNPICRACGRRQRGEKKKGVPACACDRPDFDADAWRLRGREAFIAFLSAAFKECLRVIKPGGYALVWAIPRTSHWTATALEDAGWEIRDRISHLFGQGFPKGKGCLKPAVEDWWLCRAPGRGVRPLGIEECRIEGTPRTTHSDGNRRGTFPHSDDAWGNGHIPLMPGHPTGRWPANLVLDEQAAAMLDAQAGPTSTTGKRSERSRNATVEGTAWGTNNHRSTEYANEPPGGPSRFFYCPKASKSDRGEGNTHPTVKPTKLCEWLIRLVACAGETVLDPFAGSGTTLVAALRCGRKAVGIEKDAGYFAIAEKRIAEAQASLPLFAEES